MEEPTLRESMKAISKDVHEEAEQVLLPILTNKLMTWNGFKIFATSHYYIYATLEKLLEENKEHKQLAPLYLTEVSRLKSLEQDLEYLYGSAWKDKIECNLAIQNYVSHLDNIKSSEMHLLVPHLYVRYLGDLSGGQTLKRIFKRMFDLPEDGSGLAFYEFEEISDIKEFKNLYGCRMDGIELTSEERNAVLNETIAAFRLNIDFFKFLESVINEERKNSPEETNTSDDLSNGKEEIFQPSPEYKTDDSFWITKQMKQLVNFWYR